MSIVEFKLPEELRNVSAAEIEQRILARLPDTIDKTEGGFVWDFTMPTALEEAELLEFWLPLALKTMSHIWAKGYWLDLHAYDCGLERLSPTYSYGDVEVVTTEAVTFPAGFIFSVPSENSSPAIEFETLEEISCDEATTLTIHVKAVESGTGSNVKHDTITIMKTPIRGVESITNPSATSGGTAAEDDESLRQRIDDYYAGRGASFVGNKKDYERWARMVAGVGYAHCIPTYDGANSVKLVIADANGDPANNEILRAVEKFIFGTGHDDINRLAPIGVAKYEVSAPDLVTINYSLDIKLEDDFTLEQVEELIRDNLGKFYATLADDDNYFSELRYVAVSKVILETNGVADFKHLRINGTRENISFAEDEMPMTGTVELTAYD